MWLLLWGGVPGASTFGGAGHPFVVFRCCSGGGTLERQRTVNADASAEILIMAHQDERAGIGFERLHQLIHRRNSEGIRRLIQHE